MSDMNLSHQVNLFNPERARTVHVIGVGSVGSWTAYLLAKVGIRDIHVWDADVVSSHNCPMSLYGVNDVARHKVDVLAERIKEDTGVDLKVHRCMYQGEKITNASVIACVDSMAARKVIWEQVAKRATIDLFCDTRLAAAYVEVLAIEPTNREECERYETLHFSDDEAIPQVCGQHGIVYASLRAAGIVTAALTGFWTSGMKVWRVAERCDTLERAY